MDTYRKGRESASLEAGDHLHRVKDTAPGAERLALQSDKMIRNDVREVYVPQYNMEMTRQDLVQTRSEFFTAHANIGFTWESIAFMNSKVDGITDVWEIVWDVRSGKWLVGGYGTRW